MKKAIYSKEYKYLVSQVKKAREEDHKPYLD